MIVAGGVTRPVAWTRAGWIAACGVLVALLVMQVRVAVGYPARDYWIGHDFLTYRDAAAAWLGGGPFYHPYQLAGPYLVAEREILYPPVALLVFAPFTVLPAILWWAIPLGVTAWVVWWHRPSPLGWLGILACLTVPMPFGVSWAMDFVVNGNPGMWIMAAVALATRWPAAAPWVLLKPTLAPFALLGIRRRSWWLGLGVFVAACLAFAPMWPDYLTVLGNARTVGPSLLYSVPNVTLLLIPVIASGGVAERRGDGPAAPTPAPARLIVGREEEHLDAVLADAGVERRLIEHLDAVL